MDRLDSKRAEVREILRDTERLGQQKGLVVGQVMTPSPSCITPETNALELVRLFHAKQFRHLLVEDEEGHLVGVISDRDVIRCLGPDHSPQRATLARITAAEIMSTDLVTANLEMPLEEAVARMLEEGISCLPVVSGQRLVGILTNTDLHVVLQLLLRMARSSNWEESVATTNFERHD
jgi:acetoin utilization protein AcuB